MILEEGEKEACTHRGRGHGEAGGQARPGRGSRERVKAWWLSDWRAARTWEQRPSGLQGAPAVRRGPGGGPLDPLSAPCKSAKVGLRVLSQGLACAQPASRGPSLPLPPPRTRSRGAEPGSTRRAPVPGLRARTAALQPGGGS